MKKIFQASRGLLLAVLFAATTAATTVDSWGPELNSAIPDQLETKDQDGNGQSFETLVGKKGLAIVFLRSLDWCRFCKAQAKELDAKAGKFAIRGIRLVTLSYDSVDTLKAFQLEYAPHLTLLSDPQSRVIKAFGILNRREKPGSRGYGIANPGIMVVDNEGVMRVKFVQRSFRNRPQIDDVLTAIDQLEL